MSQFEQLEAGRLRCTICGTIKSDKYKADEHMESGCNAWRVAQRETVKEEELELKQIRTEGDVTGGAYGGITRCNPFEVGQRIAPGAGNAWWNANTIQVTGKEDKQDDNDE